MHRANHTPPPIAGSLLCSGSSRSQERATAQTPHPWHRLREQDLLTAPGGSSSSLHRERLRYCTWQGQEGRVTPGWLQHQAHRPASFFYGTASCRGRNPFSKYSFLQEKERHLRETGTFPRSAPRSISLDQLTDSTWVGTLCFLALCRSDTAPGLRGILRPGKHDRHTISMERSVCRRGRRLQECCPKVLAFRP